jgi:hypothetical protein
MGLRLECGELEIGSKASHAWGPARQSRRWCLVTAQDVDSKLFLASQLLVVFT